MLDIVVPSCEEWNEAKQEFVYSESITLTLEHSLISLSKWESKWRKPFLSRHDKTQEEIIDYIKCMTITRNVDPNIYYCLSEQNIKDINDYIESPMSATFFSDTNNGSKINGDPITSEIIYYWMIALNIPLECQKWHLNRLLTLIKVCNIKNQPPKMMSAREVMERNTTLNEIRKKQFNTKG